LCYYFVEGGAATRRAAAGAGEGAKRAATNSMMGMTIQVDAHYALIVN